MKNKFEYSRIIQMGFDVIDIERLWDTITTETMEDTTEVEKVDEKEDKQYGLVFKFE